MAFDCMAIGVGLVASVMARWAPNERFTYGYVSSSSNSEIYMTFRLKIWAN